VRRLQLELQTSGHRSIDSFLERQGSEIIAAGKMAIAAALLPIEGAGRLFPPRARATDHGTKTWFNGYRSMIPLHSCRTV
jgi:hypothetical protein